MTEIISSEWWVEMHMFLHVDVAIISTAINEYMNWWTAIFMLYNIWTSSGFIEIRNIFPGRHFENKSIVITQSDDKNNLNEWQPFVEQNFTGNSQVYRQQRIVPLLCYCIFFSRRHDVINLYIHEGCITVEIYLDLADVSIFSTNTEDDIIDVWQRESEQVF